MRRVTTHQAKNNDHEFLQVVTVWEEGKRKRDIKSKYSQEHSFLVKRRNKFKLIQEKNTVKPIFYISQIWREKQ